jgi:hypothetical protein
MQNKKYHNDGVSRITYVLPGIIDQQSLTPQIL